MQKLLLILLCVSCMLLCACRPSEETPASTPSSPVSHPQDTPSFTLNNPDATPGDEIDVFDPSPEVTPVPSPEVTPVPSPEVTPTPTPEVTPANPNQGIHLPYIPG